MPIAPLAQGIHALPRGAGPGVLVHELMEQSAQQGFSQVCSRPELAKQLVDNIFKLPAWDGRQEELSQTLLQWLTLPLLATAELGLSDLAPSQYQAEMEFLLGADNVDTAIIDSLVCKHTFAGQPRPHLLANQINGLLKGFIDLVFTVNGQYYVLDYKFNALGNDASAYSQANLEQAMLSKRYDLQAVLYLLALHRLLKTRLGDAYDYDAQVGGSVYLFLRGVQSESSGRVLSKPPRILIETLDSLFCGASATGIAA